MEPDERNGLHSVSSLMVDNMTTVPNETLGSRIGMLGDADLVRLIQAMLVFLGIARPPILESDATTRAFRIA